MLVASADEGTRAQVRLTLGDERFDLHEASDSDAAVHVIVGSQPRLLVLDLALPGAGALAIARTVQERSGDDRPRILVLVPRGESLPESAPGVDATLAMPATSFALLRKVDSLLEDA